MNEQQTKQAITDTLAHFATGSLATNALELFDDLGYRSEKHMPLEPNTAEMFLDMFDGQGKFNRAAALTDQWQSVDLLFQLDDNDLHMSGQFGLQFDSAVTIDNTRIESYLFFAVALRDKSYTRTQLATITREINKLFPMPIMVLFKHGSTLTFAVINRRLHKRDTSRDVLEKVTLIKDIAFEHPHRAHVEILWDLSLEELHRQHQFKDFVGLHRAWETTLDSSELNKRFFREIANWYFWAIKQVVFPKDAGADEEVRNATSVIRLITRLIFVWFLKEKELVPDVLFNRERARNLLTDLDEQSSSYYKAILQNLFFATLNTEMNDPAAPRKFRSKNNSGGRDGNYMAHTLYRYEHLFHDPDAALALFKDIPFLNGGLFECLDKEIDVNGIKNVVRVDGFSDRPDNPLSVPNDLFFGKERQIDLNTIYGTKGKRYKVRGLIHILNSYKFTITENTPIEEEIALDPELLGRVFENLLASYNPETKITARKQTGSFYTPREIVNYMVDESLIAYLKRALTPNPSPGAPGEGNSAASLFSAVAGKSNSGSPPSPAAAGEGGRGDEGHQADLDARLRHLFAYNKEPHRFTSTEVEQLITAIDNVKILDPACGSGAFPMGILHKLVFILSRLDPRNQQWKQRQIDKVDAAIRAAEGIDDTRFREATIAGLEEQKRDIEQAFERNELDYGRKLYLIENCIYGVDIQPIAVQIAKLRCFISLIVDQKIDDAAPNRNIRSLPNLETKFVAANTLIGIAEKRALRSQDVLDKEQQLAEVRRKHFTARTPATKRKYRERDKQLRDEISALLRAEGFSIETAEQLSHWDPYDQNISASFFDPQWMFGVDGFDIVIGNPPYVRHEQIGAFKPLFQQQYTCYTGTADLYVYFYERGVQVLNSGGTLSYISSNKYFRSGYGAKLRSYLSANTTIEHLIDFGDAPVFTAIAYPSIITTSKTLSNGNIVRVLTWQPGLPVEEFPAIFAANSFPMPQKELTADGWRLEDETTLRLLDKLRGAGTPLGTYVNGRFYYGIKTGLNEAFVVDRATRDRLIAEHPSSAEVLKPFLRGRDVKRWRVNYADYYLIKIESSENKRHPWSGKPERDAERIFAKTYPAIHTRFQQFRDKLIKRDDQGKYFWELRSCVYWQAFEEPKIVIPAIEQNVAYAPDFDGHYSNDKTSICVTGNVHYLLGLLNSKLLWWFIRQTAASRQGNFYEFKPMYVSQIPIPAATPEQQAPIIALVERILAAKRENKEADVAEWEREIDRLVYDLYGLTEGEVAVVEGR